MTTSIRRVLLPLIAAALALLAAVSPALADKLHLKDGRVLDGEVTKETDSFIYFRIIVGGIEQEQLFARNDIKKIERDEEAKKPADPAPVPAPATTAVTKTPVTKPAPAPAPAPGQAPAEEAHDPKEETKAPDDDAVKVTFITLEDEVGKLLNADALEESFNIAMDKGDPDIIVLVIDSGGGALLEVQPLSDVIHEKMKKEVRVVGWIRSAISAASLTIFNCEEIYMMTEGHVGGTVAFVQDGGGAKAAQGAALEQVLRLGEMISIRGGYDPLIMEAMQHWMVLSADIDANGVVTWHRGDKGEYMVNPKDRILTLDAPDSVKFGVAKGIADTKDDLLKLMKIDEWKEVAPEADEYQQEFRNNVRKVESRLGEIMRTFQLYLTSAQGSDDDKERGLYVGRARNSLAELRSMIKRAPSMSKYTIFNDKWFRDQNEDLDKLAQRRRR